MDDRISKDARVQTLVVAALEGQLTEAQAQELARCGPPLLEVVLLAAACRIAELKAKIEPSSRIDPSTPSGQRPVYTKPPAPRRKGKPGAHPGTSARAGRPRRRSTAERNIARKSAPTVADRFSDAREPAPEPSRTSWLV